MFTLILMMFVIFAFFFFFCVFKQKTAYEMRISDWSSDVCSFRSIVDFPWSDRPLLAHNGSNGMNLAKILVDTERDLGVVVVTNIGGQPAEDAAAAVQRALYELYR